MLGVGTICKQRHVERELCNGESRVVYMTFSGNGGRILDRTFLSKALKVYFVKFTFWWIGSLLFYSVGVMASYNYIPQIMLNVF